jgi:hypothetical protein
MIPYDELSRALEAYRRRQDLEETRVGGDDDRRATPTDTLHEASPYVVGEDGTSEVEMQEIVDDD